MIAPLFLAAALAASQSVRVEVVAGVGASDARIAVRTTWLGEDRELTPKDDGTVAGDVPADGIRVGEWTGDPVRVLPIRLVLLGEGDTETELGAWYEAVGTDHDQLVYAIDWNASPPRARRVAAALPPRQMQAADTTGVAAAVGWTGLVLAYVAWLVQRMGPK